MLATPERLRDTTGREHVEALVPRWRELPVYRRIAGSDPLADGGGSEVAGFQGWPYLRKQEIRQGFPGNFLSSPEVLEDLIESGRVEVEHTSGTSAERMTVLFARGWWDVQEARALRLNRWVDRVLDEGGDGKRAVVTTPACNGRECPSGWLPRSRRIHGSALAVNQARIPFLLPESELARMTDEIGSWSPLFLDADPVHGAWLALYCERRGLRFPSLRFIVTSYEYASVVHRRILERAFGVPVFDLYGSTETGHLLMEDEAGRMRPSHETAFLEVADADPFGVGELVVTTLTNDYMPLVRYRIGDLVERRAGVNGLEYQVHGRARDALRTGEGIRVTTRQLDECFAGVSGVAHYELRQADDGAARLRVVPENPGWCRDARQTVTARIEALLQPPGGLAVEEVGVLLPAPSGKFRLTRRGLEPGAELQP